MQIVIVVLLLVIIVLIAPWPLGLIAAGAAAYGVFLAIAAVLAVGIILFMAFKDKIKAISAKQSLDAKIAESNRIYREKEAARKAAEAEQAKNSSGQP